MTYRLQPFTVTKLTEIQRVQLASAVHRMEAALRDLTELGLTSYQMRLGSLVRELQMDARRTESTQEIPR